MDNKNLDWIINTIKYQLRYIHYNGIKQIGSNYNNTGLVVYYDDNNCQDSEAIKKNIKENVQKYLDDAHKEELRQYVCFLNSYFNQDYDVNYRLNSSKNGVKDGEESEDAHELGTHLKCKIDVKEVGLDND